MVTKSFLNRKVAVCFGGQSRTYKYTSESINNFFSSNYGNEYYFFGHTWDTNSWKIKKGEQIDYEIERIEDIGALAADMKLHYNFSDFVVERDAGREGFCGNIFYSAMRSNFLKQKYEAENNMMFDLVIKARYDIGYPNGPKFENYFTHEITEKTLYSSYGHMRPEFFLPNPDAVFYFGSSLTMDLVDSLYNSTYNDAFKKTVGYNLDNQVYGRVGDGILLHKWSSMKNVMHQHVSIPYAVYRKNSIGIDYKTEWDRLINVGWFKE